MDVNTDAGDLTADKMRTHVKCKGLALRHTREFLSAKKWNIIKKAQARHTRRTDTNEQRLVPLTGRILFGGDV